MLAENEKTTGVAAPVATNETQLIAAPTIPASGDNANRLRLFALREGPGSVPSGMIEITQLEAKRLNDPANPFGHRFGIFWLVNQFDGRRVKANLVRIRAWHADVDLADPERDKAAALDRILRGALEPSCIVETKNGYHVYWVAEGSPSLEWHSPICRAIANTFDGDLNAVDVSRVLRAPGYVHWKSGSPFAVRVIHRTGRRYSESATIQAFGVSLPVPRPARTTVSTLPSVRRLKPGEYDFEAMRAANQGDLLARLSGHSAVGGEVYSFRSRPRGGEVIYANERPSAAWIDERGRIGSTSFGGPSIYEWVSWFGHLPADVMATIREVFPEFIAGANGGKK